MTIPNIKVMEESMIEKVFIENTVVITASATLIGAFIGAAVAQYISHRLSLKREREKYYKETFQKLFSPIIFEIFSYIDIKTAFRRENDIKRGVNEEVLKQRIDNHISSNIMFATPVLISHYYNIKRHEFLDDMSGFYAEVLDLEFTALFLKEASRVLKKAGLSKTQIKKQLQQYMFDYSLWSVYTQIFSDKEVATWIMSLKFYHLNNYTYIRYKRLLGVVKKGNLLDKFKMFYYKILKGKGLEYYEITLENLPKILTSNKEDRIKIAEEYQHVIDRARPTQARKNYIKVTHYTAIKEFDYFYSNETLIVNFELRNDSYKLRSFSRNDFILRIENNRVIKPTTSESDFFIGSNKDNVFVDFEDRSVQLEYNIGANQNINNFSFYLIEDSKTHLIYYFVWDST
jgi:hypothetical protein